MKNNGDVNFIVGIELKDVKGKGIKRKDHYNTIQKVSPIGVLLERCF